MNEKAQWQNRTGSFSNPRLQCPPRHPSTVCSCWAAGVAGRERKRERGEQGLHQGCSLDRANKSRPVTCSMAPFEERGKFGQSEEKGRHGLFSLPKRLTARDRQEVRRAGRAGICFHGYGPGMGTLLLRKLRSHAPTEAMSRILKMRQAGVRTISTSGRVASLRGEIK